MSDGWKNEQLIANMSTVTTIGDDYMAVLWFQLVPPPPWVATESINAALNEEIFLD